METKNRMYLYVKAFSDLGSYMDTLVLNAIIFTATQSALWLAASMGLMVVGGMISSLLSGVVADRFDRRKLMIVSDLLRAATLAILIFYPHPVLIIAVRFVNGFVASFFQVSFSAGVPQMFGEGKVLEVNSLIARLSSVSMVVGFLLGGVIASSLGNATVLALDALTFVLSALVLWRLRWESATERKSAGQAPASATTATQKIGDLPQKGGLPYFQPRSSAWQRFQEDLREVFGYLRWQPLLMIVFVIYLIDTFGSSSHNLGIPLLADAINPQKQSFYYGLFWGVWGVGNVLSTMVLPHLNVVKRHLHLSFLVSTILMSSGFILFLSTERLAVILPAAFFTGIFDAAANTLNSTIMQQSDNHVRGRVFGVSALVNRLGFGAGFLVAPFLIDRISMPHMVWTLHGIVITSTIFAIIAALRYTGKRSSITPAA